MHGADYRQQAINYFYEQINNMNGSGALAWLRGGLELAQWIGLLTAEEAAWFDSVGAANFEAKQKAIREEKERIAAQRKAERAAAALKAKEK